MKVGVNARTFAVTEPGGAVQTAMRLTRELSERDLQLELFGPSCLSETFPAVPVISTGYPRGSQAFGLLWERTALPVLARRQGIDVLFCPNGNGPLHRTACPVVLQIHDLNTFHGYSNRVHRLYRRAAVPRAAANAAAIVTVSSFSKREIVSTLGVDPEGVHVTSNGVHEEFLEPADGATLDCPAPYVLYVGALSRRKNVDRLIAAFRHLKSTTGIPHELVLVGPEKPTITQTRSPDGVENIHTPGYLERSRLRAAYRNADAFVYPSLYEGFGLPPLEAMACDTPVVASDATALPEVLGDGAEFVDPMAVDSIADGLHRVLTDSGYRQTLVRRGRRRAATFTWDRVADRLLAVLREVVESAG